MLASCERYRYVPQLCPTWSNLLLVVLNLLSEAAKPRCSPGRTLLPRCNTMCKKTPGSRNGQSQLHGVISLGI